MVNMNRELRVGVIVRTHGIRGEVKVFPTTDSPDRFKSLKTVQIRRGNNYITAEIENVRFFKNLVIVKFKGIDDINDVEKHVGSDLMIKREDGIALSDGEYYVSDIVGLKVLTEEGAVLGTVSDVLETGANDIYLVKSDDGKEYMIPAVKAFIPDINLEEEKITVRTIPGLLDL